MAPSHGPVKAESRPVEMAGVGTSASERRRYPSRLAPKDLRPEDIVFNIIVEVQVLSGGLKNT